MMMIRVQSFTFFSLEIQSQFKHTHTNTHEKIPNRLRESRKKFMSRVLNQSSHEHHQERNKIWVSRHLMITDVLIVVFHYIS